MKFFQYLSAPVVIVSLLAYLFLGSEYSWDFYLMSVYALCYPAYSVVWKILKDFNNDMKLFVYDLILTLPIALLIFANLYKINGILDPDHLISKAPLEMIYFSIVTWTTLGYGDFQPTEASRILAAAEALLGYIYNALFLGLCAGWLLIRFQNNKDSKKAT
tara:strand:+ start:2652 stop:3134 length:483 start_codon:yes stop_codon:yes gene_type:complete